MPCLLIMLATVVIYFSGLLEYGLCVSRYILDPLECSDASYCYAVFQVVQLCFMLLGKPGSWATF
jgi:hypothetical protein